MTLPKEVRDALGIYSPQKVAIDFNKSRKTISIRKIKPISYYSGIISKEQHEKAMKKHGLKTIEDIRGWMEKNYKRI